MTFAKLSISIAALAMLVGLAHAAPTAEARARAVLKAQLAAGTDDDAFAATLAPKAIVLTAGGTTNADEDHPRFAGAVTTISPHAEVTRATYDNFAVGSAGNLVWFSADLHITIYSHEPQETPSTDRKTMRALELLDGDAGWKVTVAAFTDIGKMKTYSWSRIDDVTAPGPLTRLLISPAELASSLADTVILYGTEASERTTGAKQTKALLAKWKNLAITLDAAPKVHEVHGATYGYTMANVFVALKPGGPKYHLNALLLALPRPDGAWAVIGVAYNPV